MVDMLNMVGIPEDLETEESHLPDFLLQYLDEVLFMAGMKQPGLPHNDYFVILRTLIYNAGYDEFADTLISRSIASRLKGDIYTEEEYDIMLNGGEINGQKGAKTILTWDEDFMRRKGLLIARQEEDVWGLSRKWFGTRRWTELTGISSHKEYGEDPFATILFKGRNGSDIIHISADGGYELRKV